MSIRRPKYAEIGQMTESVRYYVLQTVAKQFGGDLLLVNPTSFVRDDVAFGPAYCQPVDNCTEPMGFGSRRSRPSTAPGLMSARLRRTVWWRWPSCRGSEATAHRHVAG